MIRPRAANPSVPVAATLCATLMLTLLSGCGALGQNNTPPPAFYSLDGARAAALPTPRQVTPQHSAPTLIVNPPRAASGFDSPRILYVREDHQLEYYAHSEWIDTPARMLAPMLVSTIERSGAFRAVVLTPSAAAGDLRLDTEIVRLQQEIGSPPSHVRLTLRAYLVDNTTRRVLAWREFDERVAVSSETPYGAVIAANRVVEVVLGQIARLCSETALQWPPPVLPLPTSPTHG